MIKWIRSLFGKQEEELNTHQCSKYKPWSQAEIDMILIPSLTDNELTYHLDRSLSSIRSKRKRLKAQNDESN